MLNGHLQIEIRKLKNPDLLHKLLGFQGYTNATSIRVGNIFLRPNDVQARLSQFANRLVHHLGDKIYQFQHFGTACGIKYRGRYFAIISDHQYRLCATNDVGVIRADGRSSLTPSSIRKLDDPSLAKENDSIDFAILEYTETQCPEDFLHTQFFPVSHPEISDPRTNKLILNVGYPTRYQNIDYFNGQISMLAVVSYLKITQWDNNGKIFKLITANEDRLIEDGLSGSPIFQVVRYHDAYVVEWLGMVVRGGKSSRVGTAISSKSILDRIDTDCF